MSFLRKLFSRFEQRVERRVAGLAPGMPYLGAVEPLSFDGGDAWTGALLGLPALTTFDDVAELLGIHRDTLIWLCYQPYTPGLSHYHTFSVPKRRGGTRQIATPKPVLAAAQTVVLREVLSRLQPHDAAMAFRRGRSIVDHARQHANQGIVIRLDLRDFFPTITRRRVAGLFRACGYNPGVATILSLLVTDRRVESDERSAPGRRFRGYAYLPQGACTSPVIANVICRRLDARLAGFTSMLGFRYSRYADDLTFSHLDADVPLGRLLQGVARIVVDEGFELNAEKTRIMRAQMRQIVTGLSVNDGVSVPRDDLRRFRAFLHTCERDGVDAVTARQGRDALTYARGYLAFVAMVEPDRANRLREKHPWISANAG